jgi:hypothetical protein
MAPALPLKILTEDWWTRFFDVISRHRTNDVIYFNPKDHTRAMGLNIFDQGDVHKRALLVSYLISIFKALWGDSRGPPMEDILCNAAFSLREQPQPVSLLAIPRLFNDPNYGLLETASCLF